MIQITCENRDGEWTVTVAGLTLYRGKNEKRARLIEAQQRRAHKRSD